MDQGLYLTFFREGESHDKELPPVGPFEHLVLRQEGLVAERKSVQHMEDSGQTDIGRLIEAELELQRAIGKEPGGTKRRHLRITAREGVYLRFASFGESAEQSPARELGPYAVVTVGPTGVEADGDLLAVPTGSKRALWDLTSTAGNDLAGVVRPDIAFRSERTAYHRGVLAAAVGPTKSEATSALRHPIVTPPVQVAARLAVAVPASPRPTPSARPAEPVTARSTETARRESSRAPATTASTAVQYAGPAASSLLTRVAANSRSAPTTGATSTGSQQGLQWAEALWTMRIVIIAVLVLFVGAFGFVSLQNNVNVPSISTVGVGKTITGARWDYTVNNISRTTTAGEATSRGIYLIIRVAVRNRATEAAALSPSEFTLFDSTGTEYPSLAESAAPYQSAQNSSSPYVWAREYPIGQFVTASLIFEIPPSIRGLQLAIREVPTTRVKLD